MLSFQAMSCCAGQQIRGLQFEDPDKMDDVMRQICRHAFGRSPGLGNGTSKPFTFYVFSGVTSFKKGSSSYNQQLLTPEGLGYRLGYVEALRAFIRVNKLGSVVTSKPEWNRVNHPDHKIMMCLWQPDVDNLKAWWKKNKVAPKVKVPTPVYPAPLAPMGGVPMPAPRVRV